MIYSFNTETNQPLEVKTVDINKQEAKGKGSVRLDTGSIEQPIYNWLGLPVFCSATLVDPEDSKRKIELISVLFTVTQNKIISSKPLNGLDGSFKTYIADGDFEVRIQGQLTTDNQTDYPLEDVKKLIELLKLKRSLIIVCDYLLIFEIHELAVFSYEVPQLEGTQNAQPFSITALSDRAIELIEKNG